VRTIRNTKIHSVDGVEDFFVKAGGAFSDHWALKDVHNTIFWHPAALYCSISFEVMLPSACSFVIDGSLSYV
jgi:hypothetical protein